MSHDDTSAARYVRRQEAWIKRHTFLPLVRHHVWWVFHNLLSHPALGLVPQSQLLIWFHDWTSMHLNQRQGIRSSTTPLIPVGKRGAWVWHNVAGHIAIGLAPVSASFAFHDRGADAMGVEDWV